MNIVTPKTSKIKISRLTLHVLSFILGLIALTCSRANCQDGNHRTVALPAIPDAPSLNVGTKNAPHSQLDMKTAKSANGIPDLLIDSHAKPKTINRQFLLLNTFLAVSTVADTETTLHCLNFPRCREANPILGSHPSRAQVYELAVPVTALAIYLSYHYKRKSPSRNWWKAYPLFIGGLHTFAAVSNLATAYGQ